MSDQLKIGAAYIRVSTDGQLDYSPESQLDEIKKYAKSNNILIDNNYIFVEQDGVSGKNADKRIAFQQMISIAKTKPKPFDCILVWKYSRFARNQDESTFYKGTLRKKYGIDVLSVSEPIMDGMYGRLIEMIIEWQDEFYSYNLAGEVHRGMKKKAELGGYNGKVPYGYIKKNGEIPIILESEANIVKEIFSMFNNGYDKPSICRYLNEKNIKTKLGKPFTCDTIQYILNNPFYIGTIRWNVRKNNHGGIYDESEWVIRKGIHEPIIGNDVYDIAKEKINRNMAIKHSYAKPISRTKHYLSGLLRCPICNKNLTYMYRKECKNNAFQCRGYKNGLHKESQYVTDKDVTAALIHSLKSTLNNTGTDFEIIKEVPKESSRESAAIEELAKLEVREKRIKAAYMEGIDTIAEYKEQKKLIEDRRKVLQLTLDSIPQKEMTKKSKENFYKSVKSVLDIIASDADYNMKGEALRSIIKYIEHRKEDNSYYFYYYIYE